MLKSANLVNQQEHLLPLHKQIKDSLKNYLAHFESFDIKHITNLYALVSMEVEKALLEIVLEYTDGNQSKAAKILGLSRNTLRKKLQITEKTACISPLL